jgi:succinate dehydrogenase/fumarate reductase flavoprotein subunit
MGLGMYFTGSFDKSADVVVVGYGDAGAVAAMQAHDLGAEVLIVEKQREDKRRPNSRFSAGLFMVPEDVDAAAEYMARLYSLNGELIETDRSVIDTWAYETAQNPKWLSDHGGEAYQVLHGAEHTFVEGYESINTWKPDMNEHPNNTGHRGWGWGLFKFLTDHVTARGIEVYYDSPAQWLLTDAAGGVIGVQVVLDGKISNIRAGRGVILTTGGFEFNSWMKLNYLKAFPTHFYGNPENTGDGIRMAQEVGAELWHMNSCAGRLVARFSSGEYPGGCPVDIWGTERGAVEGLKLLKEQTDHVGPSGQVTVPVADMNITKSVSLPGGMFVNGYGKRFTNELYRVHTLYYELTDIDSHTLVKPKIPSWWIFDHRRFTMGRLTPNYFSPTGPLQQIQWSEDNQAELDRGWIFRGRSINALATTINVDAEALAQTIKDYNQACAAGFDAIGRDPATLVALDSPPYYAVQLWPGGPNTQGGPRRDAEARIVRVTGEPIPGLYSAGELGSVYGMLYPSGGGNIAECLAFGRVAGRNAASRIAG